MPSGLGSEDVLPAGSIDRGDVRRAADVVRPQRAEWPATQAKIFANRSDSGAEETQSASSAGNGGDVEIEVETL